MTTANIQEAIAAARAKLAARQPVQSFGARKIAELRAPTVTPTSGGWQWNKEQQSAIDYGVTGKSFCLIGAAGTGKTTTLRGVLTEILRQNKLPMIEKETRYLKQGSPGVALISYTRRAVRNIAKQMPPELRAHCITAHKLIEFAPELIEVTNPDGSTGVSKQFRPQRTRYNPLPQNLRLLVIDESSMLSTDLFQLILNALRLPSQVQMIFLGDLHQLPPVYGDSILGNKLINLPIVELTQVYRQALLSPIIRAALSVKDGKIPQEWKLIREPIVEDNQEHGRVVFHPWKKKLDQEDALDAAKKYLTNWIATGNNSTNMGPLNFDEDVILCPWNKAGTFGNVELNKAIGTALAQLHGKEVYEVIAGYNKHYFSVGDRVLHDKRDAIITKITRNSKYYGKMPQFPSPTMDYWGFSKNPTMPNISDEDIEMNIDHLANITTEDKETEASHYVYLRYPDDTPDPSREDIFLSRAADINTLDLAYAMTVHKAQGSEWERVILMTHETHMKMLSRELLYTAITRAKNQLYIFMEPTALVRAASRPRIKGDTLNDKLNFFRKRAEEKSKQRDMEDEDD